jgi:hypothetical protein
VTPFPPGAANCFRSNLKGMDAEPKRYAFWFSEFGAKPKTPKATGRNRAGMDAGYNGFISFLLRKKLTAQKWQGSHF